MYKNSLVVIDVEHCNRLGVAPEKYLLMELYYRDYIFLVELAGGICFVEQLVDYITTKEQVSNSTARRKIKQMVEQGFVLEEEFGGGRVKYIRLSRTSKIYLVNKPFQESYATTVKKATNNRLRKSALLMDYFTQNPTDIKETYIYLKLQIKYYLDSNYGEYVSQLKTYSPYITLLKGFIGLFDEYKDRYSDLQDLSNYLENEFEYEIEDNDCFSKLKLQNCYYNYTYSNPNVFEFLVLDMFDNIENICMKVQNIFKELESWESKLRTIQYNDYLRYKDNFPEIRIKITTENARRKKILENILRSYFAELFKGDSDDYKFMQVKRNLKIEVINANTDKYFRYTDKKKVSVYDKDYRDQVKEQINNQIN